MRLARVLALELARPRARVGLDGRLDEAHAVALKLGLARARRERASGAKNTAEARRPAPCKILARPEHETCNGSWHLDKEGRPRAVKIAVRQRHFVPDACGALLRVDHDTRLCKVGCWEGVRRISARSTFRRSVGGWISGGSACESDSSGPLLRMVRSSENDARRRTPLPAPVLHFWCTPSYLLVCSCEKIGRHACARRSPRSRQRDHH
eukprot:1177816-Pleurochrysis_carterae.AAC.2